MGNNLWSKTDYKEICHDLHIDVVQRHCTPLTKSSDNVKNMPNRTKWRVYMPLKRILVWSDITLTLDLQTSFKVTAYFLITWNPVWTKGR